MDTFGRNNRSFTNLNTAGYTSKREISPRPYIPPAYNVPTNHQHNSALNKTTTSVHSQHLWNTLQELQLFPAELSQLLRNEDRNITLFKTRIDRQKGKANVDFDSYKKELTHYIDDLKLSVMAQLDNIYKAYMQRYAKLKSEILQIKRMRDQIEFQITSKGQNLNSNFRGSHVTSNINTVKSIENGLKDMKKYHILNYISELQKTKIGPVVDDAKELIIMTEYENGFYQHNNLSQLLTDNMELNKSSLRDIYERKFQYIRETQDLVGKEKDRGMLEGIEDPKNDDFKERGIKERDARDRDLELQNDREIKQRQKDRDRELFQIERQRQREKQKLKERQLQLERQKEQRQRERQSARQRQLQRERQLEHERQLQLQRQRQLNSRKVGSRPLNYEIPISPSRQISVYEWLQSPKISHDFSIKPQSSDIILCAIVLPSDQIAVGGKDGIVNVYKISSGERVCSLKGHRASVCSLALVKAEGIDYLATGSDHGCSSILLWELSSMAMRHRLQGHKAAVTAIVDLLDGQSMISGSYDKKINIYNLKTGKISYNLPTNKSSVTGIILNSTANKMVSCGLDNSLSVWQVIRTQQSNNAVQTLFLERIIQNNVMICSMVGSMLHEDVIYIGTKDGKVKTIDIEKGESYKTVACCNNAVIEMLALERESHPESPIIIAWPCKQECFKVVNTENGKIVSIPARGHIEFGCGIGPKGLLLSRNGKGYVGMLSQSENKRQINFYQIEGGGP